MYAAITCPPKTPNETISIAVNELREDGGGTNGVDPFPSASILMGDEWTSSCPWLVPEARSASPIHLLAAAPKLLHTVLLRNRICRGYPDYPG